MEIPGELLDLGNVVFEELRVVSGEVSVEFYP